MTMCKKCWDDAYLISKNTGQSQYEVYRRLLFERKDNPCKNKEIKEKNNDRV